MRTKSNGIVAALFMFVPLLTVAALAVFGIPQFVSVVASPVESPQVQQIELDVGVGESSGPSADDLFANFDGPGFQDLQTDTDVRTQEWDDPFHTTKVVATDQNRRVSTNPFSSPTAEANEESAAEIPDSALAGWKRESPSKRGTTRADKSAERQPLTWKDAIARLRAAGIREYRLEPAERPNEFHFSCSYTPADNPRVYHLFEAEAAEPLRAVEKVLDQIAEWRRGR